MNVEKQLEKIEIAIYDCYLQDGKGYYPVHVDNIGYDFYYRWNAQLNGMILTIKHGKNVLFQSRLVLGQKMPFYAPRDIFAIIKQKTLATITPTYIGEEQCTLKIIWMKRR